MARNPLTFEELLGRFHEIENMEGASRSIAVAAEFAAQARALEYGSVAGHKPWPRPAERTVPAIDPDTGAHVIVSAQAPQGFIRVHAHEFAQQLAAGLSASADWLDAEAAGLHLASATHDAAERALNTIRDAVPQNSGELAASLRVVE